MQDHEILNIWKSYDHKLEEVLTLNHSLAVEVTKSKLNNMVSKLKGPKRTMLFIGLPYMLLLFAIATIAFLGGAVFVGIGFGIIGLIMATTIIIYIYHLFLINQINNSEEVFSVQEKLSKLKISSFNCIRLAVIQLPFWSVCWVSLEAIKSSPLVYGGTNLVIFFGMAYLAYWLYKNLSIDNPDSKINRFFLSGKEWDPIIKSSEILEQLKGYKKE